MTSWNAQSKDHDMLTGKWNLSSRAHSPSHFTRYITRLRNC